MLFCIEITDTEMAKDEKMQSFSNIICNPLSYNYGAFPFLHFVEGEAGKRLWNNILWFAVN